MLKANQLRKINNKIIKSNNHAPFEEIIVDKIFEKIQKENELGKAEVLINDFQFGCILSNVYKEIKEIDQDDSVRELLNNNFDTIASNIVKKLKKNGYIVDIDGNNIKISWGKFGKLKYILARPELYGILFLLSVGLIIYGSFIDSEHLHPATACGVIGAIFSASIGYWRRNL